MLKKEFEKLVGGIIISDGLWSDVQRVFAAAGASDWEVFAASYADMGRPGWELCKGLAFEVERLRAAIESDERKAAVLHDSIASMLLRATAKYDDKFLFDAAVALVGMREAVVLCLSEGLPLSPEAFEYVKDNLQ